MKIGQTGIVCLKLTEVREEWGLLPLAGTNWFMLLSVKSEPGLPDLFLMPVGKKEKKKIAQNTLF